MTRTHNKPEPSDESVAMLASTLNPKRSQLFGRTQPSDPPPRAAARLRGAASGVEGPGRTPSGVTKRVAQRQRREHDRPRLHAQRKEQPLKRTTPASPRA